jgi:outer membrane protein assembly factor BamB
VLFGDDMKAVARFCWGVAALALLADGTFAAPAVILRPIVGPPTTNTNVSGTGFGANAAVDIYFDTADLCLSLTSSAGAFSCTIKVPASAGPQQHWISAVQRNTGTGAQAAFFIRTDWAQFHGMNARHNGYNPYENTLNTSTVRNLDILWSAPMTNATPSVSGVTTSASMMNATPSVSGVTTSAPVVANARVYVGEVFGASGRLHAFVNTTGAAVSGFPVTVGGPVRGSAAVNNNIVYVATDIPDLKLYAFNAGNGMAIAGFPVTVGSGSAASLFASPTVSAGNVYVAGNDGKIYAFNATNGATVPGFPITVGTSSGLFATVSAGGGRIFEGGDSTDKTMHAYDAVSGAPIFSQPVTGLAIESTAAIASGQLFFGSNDDKLYGVRGRNGQALSGYPVSSITGSVLSSPAVADGRVFVVAQDKNLYKATTGGTGAVTFETLDGAGNGSPVVANGVVYVNTFSSLYALDESSLVVLWRGAFDTNFFASPTVADGIVFLGSIDGHLYALSANGVPPSSLLPGGARGIRPAISSLKPNHALKPVRQ